MAEPAASTPVAVSVALGGGGAKGIVHIGVLQAIVERRLEIRALVGTSIGAIWAALLANAIAEQPPGPYHQRQANALAVVERLAMQLRFGEYQDRYWRSLFTDGYLKGDAFEKWLATMLWSIEHQGPLSFADLRDRGPDLTVTATDALTGDSLPLSTRTTPTLSIARAVRASMSIQGYFKDTALDFPRASDGVLTERRCWDGGNTGNCRIDIAHRHHPALAVIGSSVTYRGEPTDIDRGTFRIPLRAVRIAGQTVSILMRQFETAIQESLAAEGARVLLIRPPLMQITTLALDMPNEAKQQAIAAARSHALTQIDAAAGILTGR